MTRGGDLYSQVVAWMKIILPLTALAILSTLFLISRTVDPTQQPIVSQVDLEQRAQEQGVTSPSFAGVTSDGDGIMFRASRARPDLTDRERIIADEVVAELRLTEGTIVDITADHADMHQGKSTASLDGNVRVKTTNGYDIRTDRIDARFDILHAETPGPVEGSGPPGQISAGRMTLTSNPETGTAEILFTGGVKLVYKRNPPKE